MKLTRPAISSFQKMIFQWWKTHTRDLPWRRTHDPYHILVSEVMLQQTQVVRVLPKYHEFISAFPTITDLAKASPADVLRIWKGMGYNRRALYLQRAARTIVESHNGVFPKNEKELVKLPGLGIYTARALLVFAYRQDVSLIDTNIRQIITHFFFSDKIQGSAVIQQVADTLVPMGKSWEWHQALMDFGAIEFKKIQSLKRRDVPDGTSQVRKKSIPFKETNRFYRGRIMDLLRVSAIDESQLIKDISKQYGKPEDFIEGLIEGLADDGLVVKKNGTVALPE